jgi:hypothetical protein
VPEAAAMARSPLAFDVQTGLNLCALQPMRLSNVESCNMPAERTFVSKERHLLATAEDLSKRWGINVDQAAHILKKKMTQRMI